MKRVRRPKVILVASMLLLFGVATVLHAQVFLPTFPTTISSFTARDPGVRSDPPGVVSAGGPITGLTGRQLVFFAAGKDEFEEVDGVDEGIGPRMNLDSCGGCHAQPAPGGTSPAVNPQVAFATQGTDSVPSFLSANGPVREARFKWNADGTPDGGVHALFTISGRDGAQGCSLKQPDFDTQIRNQNIIFRIPTPTFGLGLIEQIPDSAILGNLSATAALRSSLGVKGKPNFTVAGRTVTGQTNNNGNDGTISRFGWKAQNKSLLIFSGEAYNVEMGITNELFQTEREENTNCQYASTPNSIADLDATDPTVSMSAIDKFAVFMRFLAPPTPSPDTPGGATSIANGKTLFQSTGCTSCHTPSFTTGTSQVEALSNKPVNLYSDLVVHDMGKGLADGISQGQAGGSDFRTAPLWGLGQRIFFLHDGRTSDLVQAIRAHASPTSEANNVIDNYNALSEQQKQDLLNFLRSL